MSDGGELELATLLQGMTPVIHPDVLVFLHLTNADNPPAEIRDKAVFTFREQEGNTYVVDRELVERLGYQYEFPCRRVTLNIHSSLQAVGSTRLQRVKVKKCLFQVSWQSFSDIWQTTTFRATWHRVN